MLNLSKGGKLEIFNTPGVAVIDKLIQSLSYTFPPNLQSIFIPKLYKLGNWIF